MEKRVAHEGQYYTQKTLIEGEQPIFARALMLGKTDSDDNWRLATEEEKQAVEAEQNNV